MYSGWDLVETRDFGVEARGEKVVDGENGLEAMRESREAESPKTVVGRWKKNLQKI
jgi:hypothetical protein